MSCMFINRDNSCWSHSGVMTNNIAGMSNTLLSLTTFCGDDLLTVLDCGHVHVCGTNCSCHASGHVGWHILALFDWNTVAHWFGNLKGGFMNLWGWSRANSNSSMGKSHRVVDSGISFSISLSFSFAKMMSGGSYNSSSRSMSSMETGSVTNCDWSSGSNIGCNNLKSIEVIKRYLRGKRV